MGLSKFILPKNGCHHGYLKVLSQVKSKAYEDAPISIPISIGTQPESLVPIIFSHGLISANFIYSSLLIDIASYGFLVIALNLRDGSCVHT